MARIVRQPLPDPPPVYDQAYISRLANAVNLYMLQATAQAEVVAANYICTAPVVVDPSGQVPHSVTSTVGLPTGMLYLKVASATTADSTVSGQAWASGSITLTTTAQNIPGCSLTLTRPGTWLLIATYDFNAANEQGAYLYGGITYDSTTSPHLAVCDTSSNTGRFTVGNQGLITLATTETVQMTAYKTGGSGNSSTGPQSSLTAIWISPAPDAGSGFFTVVTEQDAL